MSKSIKKKEDVSKGLNIQNFYNLIPKKFIVKVENPNFSITHNIKIPFRMVVSAPSGSGKTNFVCNLISKFSSGRQGTFFKINIITSNKCEPLYEWLNSLSESIYIDEGISNVPLLDNFNPLFNNLVIFDDLVLSKSLKDIEMYYIRARKLNVSVVFLSQSYFRVPKIIRQNCSYLVLLKLSNNREINLILSEFGNGISKENLLLLYNKAVETKMNPFIIDIEAPPESRFLSGFLEIMDLPV